jgi:hypothetical protein
MLKVMVLQGMGMRGRVIYGDIHFGAECQKLFKLGGEVLFDFFH